jgi:hypothetical protein
MIYVLALGNMISCDLLQALEFFREQGRLANTTKLMNQIKKNFALLGPLVFLIFAVIFLMMGDGKVDGKVRKGGY